jgi:3-isopropylmalate dehydrogenase
MLETFGARDEASAIEAAVEASIAANQTTGDIGGALGTREAGDFIAAAITKNK